MIAGPSRAGKSEALRRLADALVGRGGLEVSAVLIGVRPEEIADFPVTPGAALTFSASVDAQAQAVEQAVEVGRRVAARGGDAVVLIDTLEYLPAAAARRALAAGRNLAGGGSLTVIATAPAPIGGETTVVALDRAAGGRGHVPGARAGRVRHAAPGAARRRGGHRGDPRGGPARRPLPDAGRGRRRPSPSRSWWLEPAAPVEAPEAEGRRRKAQAEAQAAAKKPAAKKKPAAAQEAGGGGEAGGGEEAAAAAKKPAAKGRGEAGGRGEAARREAARKPAAAKPAAAKKPRRRASGRPKPRQRPSERAIERVGGDAARSP